MKGRGPGASSARRRRPGWRCARRHRMVGVPKRARLAPNRGSTSSSGGGVIAATPVHDPSRSRHCRRLSRPDHIWTERGLSGLIQPSGHRRQARWPRATKRIESHSVLRQRTDPFVNGNLVSQQHQTPVAAQQNAHPTKQAAPPHVPGPLRAQKRRTRPHSPTRAREPSPARRRRPSPPPTRRCRP